MIHIPMTITKILILLAGATRINKRTNKHLVSLEPLVLNLCCDKCERRGAFPSFQVSSAWGFGGNRKKGFAYLFKGKLSKRMCDLRKSCLRRRRKREIAGSQVNLSQVSEHV
jgi:hypothetical protein